MMTCQNLGLSALGPCSMAWFAFAIVFMLGLVVRRQCEDGLFTGTGFNFIAAMGLGLAGTVVAITLTGEPRWGLLAGILGLAAGGFGLGLIMDTTGAEA